jgi:hypothetical protein
MKTMYLCAGFFLSGTQLAAQPQAGVFSFQPAQTLASGRLGNRAPVMPAPRVETGKPFSATVTTQTVQTYPDGTHVSQTTTMVEYRDAEGRVRTETNRRGSAPSVIIIDPVAGATYRLDPETKTALKTLSPARSAGAAALEAAEVRLARSHSSDQSEDLGTAVVNGVTAHGARTTTVVPVGAIGNDREFRSVEERWFSSDLNLLVKSVTTDPRFGTTVYELTNVSRQTPEPSLFQVPPDYTVKTAGRVGP